MPWVEKFAQGMSYYYDTDTGHASVTAPEGFVAASPKQAGIDALVASALDSKEWETRTAASGKVYYTNPSKKLATWDLKRTLQKEGTEGPPCKVRPSLTRSVSPPARVVTMSSPLLKDDDHFAVEVLQQQNRADREKVVSMQRELTYLQEVAPDWVLEQTPAEREDALCAAYREIDAIKKDINAHGRLPQKPLPTATVAKEERPFACPRFFPEDDPERHPETQRETSPTRNQSRRLLHAPEAMSPVQLMPQKGDASQEAGGRERERERVAEAVPSYVGWSSVEEDAWRQLAVMKQERKG